MPNKVLVILNGDYGSTEFLKSWIQSADFVVAADGAADRCLQFGRIPDITIGDFDSKIPGNFPGQVLVDDDQNYTDCDKTLRYVQSQGFERAVVIGIQGSRPDHVFASLLSISRSSLKLQIAYPEGVGTILRPGPAVRFQATQIVSLLPLEPCRGASLSGVRWPLIAAKLEREGLVSSSNQGLGEVAASIQAGSAFLYAESGTRDWDFFKNVESD